MPLNLRGGALSVSENEKKIAEELRLRCGKEPTLLLPDGERSFMRGYKVTARDLSSILEIATGASAHSVKDSLKRGFLPLKGGGRLGICGTGIMGEGGIEGIKHVSSAVLRIPRQIRGCADTIQSTLVSRDFPSTLVISPPGGGKTTLLRELVRIMSDNGMRVSLADERGEVAAVWDASPQFDVGAATDILTGIPKHEAIIILLRAMNPQVIAIDEITDPSDCRSIQNAANCGVRLFATAHAADISDLLCRPLYRDLMDMKIFKTAIIIHKSAYKRRLEVVEIGT